MTRFLTRLFGTRTPAAKPARRVSLSVELLETRETPSGALILNHKIPAVEVHTISRIEKLVEKRNILALLSMGRVD